MGYYTRYSLEIDPYDENIHKHIIDEVCEGYDPFEDLAKWYEWEEEMRVISAKFPNHLFHIHGEGGESGDIWDATFKGGKAHIRKADCHIDPYDESLLE